MKPGLGKIIIPSFLFFLFLSFLLILLDRGGVLGAVKGAFENLVLPAKAKIYHLKQAQVKPSELRTIQEEKERKIAILESQISTLKSENAAMKRLLGAPLPPDWHFLPAQVIGQANTETLQINKGSADGVKEEMVVVFENVLVGKIVRVNEHFSQVQLPSSSSSRILAVTTTEGIKAKGILFGQGGRLSFERVLLKEDLQTGDWLLTAGDEVFPPNLLLGKLGKVNKKEGEIYQKAEVEPAVQSESLETVFVIQ